MSKKLLSFGLELRKKGEELRYPVDNPFVRLLFRSQPEKFPLPFEGCNDNQIEEIKKIQQVSSFPAIYEEFLRYMGVQCGDLFLGQDITYESLVEDSLARVLNLILKEGGYPKIGNDYYVFIGHQGYAYGYFPLNTGDDPPVFGYGDTDGDLDDPTDTYAGGPIQLNAHLSEFLTQFIADRESSEAQQQFLEQYAMPYR